MNNKKEHYSNLDAFRAVCCVCIVAYHIFKYSDYQLKGFGADIVQSWTWFVPLFLILSGFGMFCGYYERMRSQQIDLNSFYRKRYQKILPFFACVILVDLVVERSLSHFLEAFTEVTMVFGLLPNNTLSVVGVGWTVGVIFLFYMLFPFAVFLCWNKRRAVFSFIVSLILSLLCEWYFCGDQFVTNFTPRHSFLYCAPFFLLGGVIYLYRARIKQLVSAHRIVSLVVCILVTILYYIVPEYLFGYRIIVLKTLIVFTPWVMYAISVESRLLSNKVTSFLSGISMEIYLAQMVVYRVFEKVIGLYFFGDGWLSFIIVWIAVVLILIAGISVWKFVVGRIKNGFNSSTNQQRSC